MATHYQVERITVKLEGERCKDVIPLTWQQTVKYHGSWLDLKAGSEKARSRSYAVVAAMTSWWMAKMMDCMVGKLCKSVVNKQSLAWSLAGGDRVP
jgi:hypothetical protein